MSLTRALIDQLVDEINMRLAYQEQSGIVRRGAYGMSGFDVVMPDGTVEQLSCLMKTQNAYYWLVGYEQAIRRYGYGS